MRTMKSQHTTLTLVIVITLSLSSCMSSRIAKIKENYTQVPKSTTKTLDIPTYKSPHPLAGLEYNYWHYAKQKEKQLGLASLETSNLKNVFRVWITNPVGTLSQPHGLVYIECNSDSCYGELILMRVKFDRRNLTETITETKRTTLSPSNLTWSAISDSLINLKFHELPTDELIPDYYPNNSGYATSGPTFSFEYSNPSEYRFYQYNDIYRVHDKFWQPENVIKILDLLESEFQWDTRAREYF